MPNIMAGSLGGTVPSHSGCGPEVVSAVINNACNLSCRHCYLQAPSRPGYLSPAEWLRAFDSVLSNLSPSILCFAGKEPFLNTQSATLVRDTILLRDEVQPNRRTQIGVITNGTLIHSHRESLEQARPDYVDVSVDGLPSSHDLIRGKGAFGMVAPNLLWLVEILEDRLWLTHTILGTNVTELPQFIAFYNREFGIRNFSLGLYKDLAHTDSTLAMSSSSLAEEIDRALNALGNVDLASPVRIVMDIDLIHEEEVDFLKHRGWFGESSKRGTFKWVSKRQFHNGVKLQIQVAGVPVGLWHAIRITPEGFWLAPEDMIHPVQYEELAVGRLQDYAFDAQRLYQVGLRSKRLQLLLSQSESSDVMPLPILSEVHG